ncbi:hypothetical protein BDY24DRAFT_348607 [Mrakia frigida]|uniref:uncharacterized protein n=1 Tax=Mrakia frigida TaxID=29902 RepID=UPI003FCC0693
MPSSTSALLLARLSFVPPSQFLPRLGRDLSNHEPALLLVHILTLGKIFLPPVLGSGKEKPSPGGLDVPDSGYNSSTEFEEVDEDDPYAIVRNDEFEHNASRDWLVSVVKKGSDWMAEVDEDSPEMEERENVIDKAASTLAVWSGTSAAGALLRTIPLPQEIVLTINDAAYSSHSRDSVGVQTWGSSILFARRIAQSPSSFSLLTTTHESYHPTSTPQRILELGAGTGVLSLTMASLPDLPPRTLLVATDYNPLVMDNLRKNVLLNFPEDSLEVGEDEEEKGVKVYPLDWLAFHDSGEGVDVRSVGRDGIRYKEDVGVKKEELIGEKPFNERFDVIFGADIVYEAHHAPWIHSTVSQFLRLPSPSLTFEPSFHLFVPLRPTHQAEIVSIEATFPAASSFPPREEGGAWRLAAAEVESLVRTEGVGRADETCYRRYRIAWV